MTSDKPPHLYSLPDGIRLPDEITEVTLITERPGSRVWKVAMVSGDVVAVKYTTGEVGQSRSFAHHEAAVLTHVDPDRLYAFSHTTHGRWLAVDWDSSPSLAHHCQHVGDYGAAAVDAAPAARSQSRGEVRGVEEALHQGRADDLGGPVAAADAEPDTDRQ